MLNEKIAAVRRAAEDRLAPYGLADQLPDLIAQKYSDSGNQRPAPQVPVGSREVNVEIRVDWLYDVEIELCIMILCEMCFIFNVKRIKK